MKFIFYFSIILALDSYSKAFFINSGGIYNLIVSPEDRTHTEMTKCAFYKITFEYLETKYEKEVKKYVLPPSQDGRCAESETIMKSLFGSLNINFKLIKNSLESIAKINRFTDLDEQENEEAHFDSEKFDDGAKRLLLFKKAAIISIKSGNLPKARSFIGRLLHTLQDFYSHSNWVESISLDTVNVFLAKSNNLGNIADKLTLACTYCDSKEQCKYNINQALSEKKLLTSGFFSTVSKNKPSGKCSHGGFADKTRENSHDGINKDKSSSPHGYLHLKAANLAEISTYNFFHDLRYEIGDVYFGELLGFKGNTIAIIFETDDILNKKIKTAENVFKKYDLSTSVHNFIFSAPGINLLEAENLAIFLEKIDKIPIESIKKIPFFTRIINALQKCEQNSIFYLHANILLLNVDLNDEIIPLAVENNIVVNIVFDVSDDAYKPKKFDTELTRLAKVTGGSVWYLTDIDSLPLLINADSQIDNLQTILIVDIDEIKEINFDKFFYIDTTIENFYITISPNVKGWIEKPSNERIDLNQNTNMTQLIFNKPMYGQWRLNVNGKSFSIKISATSGVMIKSNLYLNNDLGEEKLTEFSKIPTIGQNLTILTVIDDELKSENVYIEILSKTSDILSTHYPYKHDTHLYLTWFLVPLDEFRIKFNGVNQKTQELIERYENELLTPTKVGIYLIKDIHKSYIMPGREYNLTYVIKYRLKDEIVLKLVIRDTLGLIYKEKSLRINKNKDYTESLIFSIPISATSLESQVDTIIVSVFDAYENINEPVNYETIYVPIIPSDFFLISPDKNHTEAFLFFIKQPIVYGSLIIALIIVIIIISISICCCRKHRRCCWK